MLPSIPLSLLFLIISLCFGLVLALPQPVEDEGRIARGEDVRQRQRRWADIPIRRRRGGLRKRWAVGLGDDQDLFYSVALQIGKTTSAFNLDTGSSDLWTITDACTTVQCKNSTANRYPNSSLQLSGPSVLMQYGDSVTGTNASGPIAHDTVTLAGLSVASQQFAGVNKTNSPVVLNENTGGIFGLGFPSESVIQAAVVNAQFKSPSTTDHFVTTTGQNGPLLSRLAISKQLDQPMFTISLQRDTVDVGGNTGLLSVGAFPNGVDNSSFTWVPVRRYTPADGGLTPPTFASKEVYPLRWEVALDAVYLDGKKLNASTINGSVSSTIVSAIIDTGNSLIRGPKDVVQSILSTVSTSYAQSISTNPNVIPTYPCATPHTLAFGLGGKIFPVDPRDFVVPSAKNDATTCYAGNVVSTDPPSVGALFSWSLGDPFFKSNIVAFYYGNLTNPSVDPPRIGFYSTVPSNANDLLQAAVASAQSNGGNFASITDDPLATTAYTGSSTTVASPQITGHTSPHDPSGAQSSQHQCNSAFSSTRLPSIQAFWSIMLLFLAFIPLSL
ncbi:hypothetical protein JAAARDRAFT_41981 [Jaapia argillacea MUCL 33604]|uniref:Peptidase A1 domain-containing protein n=1 Tax=Jaapia argillacea MUCL 33604 TaxID=933084 RepID=A0A067P6Y6_9AGAM|nr:hypothetical protein JAAARDRAFT_41981 [Jaapia argillacea MUCL 33604]